MKDFVISVCPTCGQDAHNYAEEEVMSCVPPRDVLKFGEYIIDEAYRNALFEKYPMYTAEEVVGSYLGYNPYFPDENSWFEENENYNNS